MGRRAGPREARFPAMTIQRFESGPRMSQAVTYGDMVFLAGQVAGTVVGAGVTAQTQEILGEIDRLLAAAGTDKSRILTATIYLADIATFAEMNAAWDAWVARDNPPARATVEAKLAAPEYLVEIVVVAAKGNA
jgi:enamine deaminase RidA (YjgF/YER057c/UK114 family)